MALKILVMGLPGSGKTTFCKELLTLLPDADYFNADIIRKKYDDWDFSLEGRIRQAERMREACDQSTKKYAIADFICPLKKTRKLFDPGVIVWIDTIQAGRYTDTNEAFQPPMRYDFRVTSKDAAYWAEFFISQYNF